MEQKIYTLFAGVNGSGKSTLYKISNLDPSEPRVNPDEIVQSIGNWRNDKDQIEAARIAVKRIKDYTSKGISFNQETTLAGRSILQTIKKIKEAGYKINLMYIGLDTPEIAKKRVKQRVEKGGHDINSELIDKRYHESLKNLKEIIPLCDSIKIFDNTNLFVNVMQVTNGELVRINGCKWLDPILRDLQEERIRTVIQQGGYQVKPELIQDLKKVQKVFGKEFSLKELKELYQNKESLTSEKKLVIEEVVKDFIQAEKEELLKKNIQQFPYPEL